MKKAFYLFILLTTILAAEPQNKIANRSYKERIDKLESKTKQLELLEKKVTEVQSKYEYLDKLNEKTLNSISNQISAASYSLTMFGILFGITAIGIGLYITYIERKIVRISDDSKNLFTKNQQIKSEIENLNKLIQDDINGLYLKIKREETVHILNRLIKVPRDIANLAELLLSRELEKEDFIKIKTAYLKLLNKEEGDSYKLIFFQHFMNQAMKDVEIRNELQDYFATGIECSFENDIVKTSEDFVSSIIDLGIASMKVEINKFFEGLAKSEYKSFNKIFEVFFEKLKSRDNRFLFLNTIDTNQKTIVSKLAFTNLLIQKYGHDELLETEKMVIDEVTKMNQENQSIENTK